MPKSPDKKKEDAEVKASVTQADAVIRKITKVDDEAKGKYNHLPVVSAVFDSGEEMQRAITLLEQGHALKEVIDQATKGYDAESGRVAGLEEVKEDVIAIALGADVAGYRYGTLCTAVDMVKGRKTLNKDKLRELMLAEGFDPTKVGEIIDAAHVEGEPYYRVEFRKLA